MKKILKTLIIIGSFTLVFISFNVKAETKNPEPENGEQNATSTPILQEETPTTTEPTIFSQTNRVTVDYLNQIIFDGNVITTGTNFSDENGDNFTLASTTALGALSEASRQNNFGLNIKNYGGTSYYVSNIDNHAAAGFDGWIYTVNMADPGWVGINDYILKDNDWLTVYYSLWPWKLEIDTTTISVGQNAIFTAYNYSSSTWNISPSTSISIGNKIFTTDQSGEYSYSTTTTGTIKAFIYGSSDLPQNSPAVNLNIIDAISPPTSSSETTTTNGGGGSSDPQPYLKTSTEIQDAIKAINNYIKSKQSEDGKIVDGPTTDWAAMSLVTAGNQIDSKMINYIYNYNFTDSSELNLCASYPRHILALKAVGYPNTNSRIQNLSNYIIANCYKNNLYGVSGINDDVFGLMALLNIGISNDSPIIQDIIQTIIKDQTANGAFTWSGYEGADITGAAINALKYAEADGATIDHKIYSSAESYLKSTQLNDGGWGYDISDALTTSWVLMGINALNENPQTWVKNDHTPYSVLINTLNDEGYYESSYTPGETDWFGEKHAAVALAQKTWPINPINLITENSGGSSAADATVTTSTTTTIITTTTIETPSSTIIATNTLELVETTTTLHTNNEITAIIQPTVSKQPVINKPIPNPIIIAKKPLEPTTSAELSIDTAATSTPLKYEKAINDAPLPSPFKKYAKIVLTLSGGSGILIGLYVAFKFIKNIV